MMQSEGTVSELCMIAGSATAYIACEPSAIPAPGRYILAHAEGSDAPLPMELFAAVRREGGFIAAPPIPDGWRLGSSLNLRGPLGIGFELPQLAHRVALIAFSSVVGPLLPLAEFALRQDAAVALICQVPPSDLPLELEIHPPQALAEVYEWADYAAFDVERESIPALQDALAQAGDLKPKPGFQALVRTRMPCGGIAECGVCTVRTTSGPQLACVDGPVFDLGSLLLKR